jgi:hypothetical protein
MDKIYYPLQPLYSDVWRAHGTTAKTVKEISEEKYIPISDRDDLSIEDKRKAG